MRPFLPERFASIQRQTFNSWEAFVLDGFSTDGAWQYITEVAGVDPRIRATQAPREGPYPAWNRCIEATSGEFVYIATSDDGMAENCLEELVRALDSNPDCDLAHCSLRVIDSGGMAAPSPRWPDATMFAAELPGIESEPHVRRSPYDALLHLTGTHVYLSITQLLIRRSLLAKTGLFSNRWGNISDFNWEMRAALAAHTVHVPHTWASWRIHDAQATVTSNFMSPQRDLAIEEMIADAITHCGHYCADLGRYAGLISDSRELRLYYSRLGHGLSWTGRRLEQARSLIGGSSALWREFSRAICRKAKWPAGLPTQVRSLMGTAVVAAAQPKTASRDVPGNE